LPASGRHYRSMQRRELAAWVVPGAGRQPGRGWV